MPQCAHCGAALEKPQSAWQKKQAAGEKPPQKQAAGEKPAEKPRPKTWYSEWQPRTFSFVSLDSASKSNEVQEADESLTLGVPRPLQPVLAALALLAVAAVLILFALPRRAAPKTLAAAPVAAPAPVALSSPAMSPALPVPLTVTLSSSSVGRRVAVGTPVTIAAFATLGHGQSATLAVSYRENHGHKTLLSLAQGSLSSAVWTPLTPGRYVFQANVLDDQKHSATSERLAILADAAPPSRLAERLPALPPRPVMAKAVSVRLAPGAARPAVRLAARPAVHVAAKPAVRPVTRPIVRVAAAKPAVRIAAKPIARVAAARPIVRVAASPPERFAPQVQPHFSLPRSSETAPVHVAAAAFLYERNASLLAAALRARGFRAVARRGVDGKGQPAYVVQTGIYLSQERAQSQMRLLQSDGYPAYSFQDSGP